MRGNTDKAHSGRSRCWRPLLCAAVLCLAAGILFGVLQWRDAAVPRAVIWAGSDLQGGGADGSVLAVLLDTVQEAGIRSPDEAFFLGDYCSAYDAARSGAGIAIVRDVFSDAFCLEEDDILFLQGNHDPTETPGLDAGGAYVRDAYSVYLIHEREFPWYQAEEDLETVRAAAQRLEDFLAQRLAAEDRRPVFVLTHMPFHMSWREDNRYAKVFVDVLNEAGAAGLNLIVLFAHNHSDDYDSYLGGSCIYLARGSRIPVPDPTAAYGSMKYTTERLQFTYLNAGYVGFTATGEDGEALSCTVFSVYRDRVELTRYDASGVHALKNPGQEGILDAGWVPDLTTVPGSVTIPLK